MIWTVAAFAGPDWPKRDAAWAVAASVATGSQSLGGREVHATYRLVSARTRRGEFTVATERSTGEVLNGSQVEASYDSAHPSSADPWPLTLQHTVASVPVALQVIEGRPVGLVDPERWASDVRAALAALGLPVEADEVGEALVDAEGLLADLQRTFPGRPPGDTWERPDRIAGIQVVRREVCHAPETDRGLTEVVCFGAAAALEEGPARLFEVSTSTQVSWDRRGLVAVRSTFSGTLVVSGSDGVLDKPIAGIRQLSRME